MKLTTSHRLQLAAGRNHSLNDTGIWSLLQQRFMEVALERPYTVAESGFTDGEISEVVAVQLAGWNVAQARKGRFRTWFAQNEQQVVWFESDGDGDWRLYAAGDDAASVDTLVGRFVSALPQIDSEDGKVPFTFYVLGGMGPISFTRRLAASTWSDVAGNYPNHVAAQVEGLMTMGPPESGGRLVLMHGPPGTGKTHAVRALSSAWSPWCEAMNVVDADAFFDEAAYMVTTMCMDTYAYGDKWRLIILEDSGEFLTREAYEKKGGGLSRLLNLADGIVGQGLHLIVLMTTNEPVTELAPALRRPGRCLAEIEFPAFDATGANRWLEQRRPGLPPQTEDLTLAELYELAG